MHRCPKVGTFHVFVDTGIEGAEHLNQASLGWHALLSPAVAVVANIHEHSYALLVEEEQVYWEVIWYSSSFFWQQEERFLKPVYCYTGIRLSVPLEDKMRSLVIIELEDVLIGGLPNLQHPTLQSVFVGLFLCCEARQRKPVIVTLILCIHSPFKENLYTAYTVK